MRYRTFGAADIWIPAIGLGCARIGSFNNPASSRQSMCLLQRALEIGVTLFDTADIYGQGDSERAIGRLLHGRREAGVVVTKVGYVFSAKMQLMRPIKPLIRPFLSRFALGRSGMNSLRQSVMAKDFSAAHILRSLEASLMRLRTDFVDVLLLHDPSLDVVYNPAIVETLYRIRESGKVRAFGIASEDADVLSAALDIPGLEVLQTTSDASLGLRTNDRDALVGKRIALMVRGVVRRRMTLSPADAVASALSEPAVACAIVGTTVPSHIEEIVKGIAEDLEVDNQPSVSTRRTNLSLGHQPNL